MNETTEFLEQLWGGKPEELYLLIWTLADKKSAWFQDVEDAAQYVSGCSGDVYVGVGLSDCERPANRRCPANEIVGIAGMWADVDYEDGAAHKSSAKNLPLPPDGAAARKIIEAVGLRPTIIVHSGHGLQAWWLLKEPLIFNNEMGRKAAATMSRLWQKNIQKRAATLGWSVDSVPDLARILRVPGTKNCKTGYPVPVQIHETDGPRYVELPDFEEVLPESLDDVQVQMKDDFAEPRGREYWKETIWGVSEGTRNSRMTSLAGKLFQQTADIDDQDCAFIVGEVMLLVNEKNKPPLPDEEVRNSWQSIWKKEKSFRAGLEAEEMFDSNNEDVLSEVGSEEKKMEFVRRNLGDLPVREITKRGKHDSEYVFELQDGTRIIAENILNQDAVRKKVMDATGGDEKTIFVPLMKKNPWSKFCGRIAALAREIETTDAERGEQVYEWIQDYLNKTQVLPDDRWEGALVIGCPFQRDGMIFINVKHFYQKMRFDIPVKAKYLRSGLIDLSFVLGRVDGYVEDDKGMRKKMNKQFWHIAIDDLSIADNPSIVNNIDEASMSSVP